MNRATAFRTVIDRIKTEEQKTIMKKITNEEDYMIEAISEELLRASMTLIHIFTNYVK